MVTPPMNYLELFYMENHSKTTFFPNQILVEFFMSHMTYTNPFSKLSKNPRKKTAIFIVGGKKI